MSVVGIWSGKNVLKHAFINSTTMNKPDTSDGGLGFFSTKTIVHDFGYKPLVRAYYDPNSDGSIFPTVGQFGGVSGGLTSDSPLDIRIIPVVPFSFFIDDVTTTTVVFRTYGGSSLGGTFPFYYRIYRDPEV